MEKNSDGDEDRVSSLPEPLIHHILSFLEMKSVVQTSVLSRTWRYVWTSLSTLVFESNAFDSSGEHKVSSFTRFVKRVLMLRDGSDIKIFELYFDCDSEKLTKHLDTWILAVVRRNVQELSIEIEDNDDLVLRLPHSLVTSELLTELYLDFDGTLVLPDSMSLPRLKYLFLRSFQIEDLKSVNKLLLGCPVLETLVINGLCVSAGNELSVNNRQLEHLEIISHDQWYYRVPRIIKLCTPSLTSFICKDYMIREYCLEDLSSLVTASIKLRDANTGKQKLFPKRMLVFLMACQNVKELTLSMDFLQVLSGAPDLVLRQLPQFRNLQCLELEMCFHRCYLRAFTYLQKITPRVESISITSKEPDSKDDGEVVSSWACKLFHLKYIEIREVKGCHNELVFLESVLKNALLLEEMVLYFCNAGSTPSPDATEVPDKLSVMKKFGGKLKALPRASSSLIMLFC